jgi:hypothetical protein
VGRIAWAGVSGWRHKALFRTRLKTIADHRNVSLDSTSGSIELPDVSWVGLLHNFVLICAAVQFVNLDIMRNFTLFEIVL